MKFSAFTILACVAAVLAQGPIQPPSGSPDQWAAAPSGTPGPNAWDDNDDSHGRGDDSRGWGDDSRGWGDSWSSGSHKSWGGKTWGDDEDWGHSRTASGWHNEPSASWASDNSWSRPTNGSASGWTPTVTPPSTKPSTTPLQYTPGPNAAGIVGVSMSMVAGILGIVGLVVA